MKFGKALVIVVATLGMLASGLAARADGGPGGGATAGSSPVMSHGTGATSPAGAAQPVTNLGTVTTQPTQNLATAPARPVPAQPLVNEPQPSELGSGQPAVLDRWQDDDDGRRGRHGGDPDTRDLKNCHCTNLELFTPKEKTAEAFLFDVGPGLRFVEVRVAIGHRVRCTPVDPFLGCAAYLVLDQESSGTSWNSSVKDLNMLPLKLGCPGKCDGNWHSGESYLVYYGWVLGSWPTTGTVHFKVVGMECDEVQDADIWATVTFDGAPGAAVGVVLGTVSVEYAFSAAHPGY